MFVEEWLEALGYKDVRSKEMPPWRRQHMSNLLKAFDFDNVRSARAQLFQPRLNIL